MKSRKSYLPELRALCEKLCAENEPPMISDEHFLELIEMLKTCPSGCKCSKCFNVAEKVLDACSQLTEKIP